MASTFADLTEVLRQALLERYGQVSAPLPAIPFLAFESGTPVPSATFQTPAGQAPGVDRLIAMEYMARQANRACLISQAMFYPTALDIDALYHQLAAGATATGDGVQVFEAAKASAMAALDDWLASVIEPHVPAARYRRIEVDPDDWFRAASQSWGAMSLSRSEIAAHTPTTPIPSSNPMIRWRAASDEIRPLLADPPNLRLVEYMVADAPYARPTAGVVDLVQRQPTPQLQPLAAIVRPELARILQVGARHSLSVDWLRRVAAVPPPVGDPVVQNRRRLRHSVHVLRPESNGTSSEVKSSGFSIQLETCLVRIRRPWLSSSFLSLSNWHVPSFAKGELSDGIGDGDQDPLGAIPIAAVLVRDVRICASESTSADYGEATTASHLGSFALVGRNIERTADELAITIPGMQIIGWICQAMPILPPLSAPNEEP